METIAVDREKYRQPIPHKFHMGIEIELFIPPFLIPYSVQGTYIGSKDIFKIQFIYGDVEPEKVIYEDKNICLTAGRNSNKLLKIMIKKIKERGIDRIMLKQKIKEDIGKIIEQRKETLKKLIEKENFEKNKLFLQENAEKLAKAYGT